MWYVSTKFIHYSIAELIILFTSRNKILSYDEHDFLNDKNPSHLLDIL